MATPTANTGPAKPQRGVKEEDPEQIAALQREIEAEAQKEGVLKAKIEQAREQVAVLDSQLGEYAKLTKFHQKQADLVQQEIAASRQRLERQQRDLAGNQKITQDLQQSLKEAQEISDRLTNELALSKQQLAEQQA